MSLSLALQERLIKRGIINANPTAEESDDDDDDDDEDEDDDDEEEEVFAENYDERDDHQKSQYSNVDIHIEHEECIKCPNKWNPYHTCVEYCKKRYGIKSYTPDPTVEKRRRRMLKKYPLPSNWREVPDATVDRCYYWNLDTDEVSWLPPAHPRSYMSQSAIKIRHKEMERKAEEARRHTAGVPAKKKQKKNTNDDGDKSETDEEDLNPVQKLKRKIAGKMLTYDADPMDPSSYSDVPRGNWASGLEVKGKAKTGADETANGELYQMRPYPSPGDILRMNAEHGKKKMKH